MAKTALSTCPCMRNYTVKISFRAAELAENIEFKRNTNLYIKPPIIIYLQHWINNPEHQIINPQYRKNKRKLSYKQIIFGNNVGLKRYIKQDVTQQLLWRHAMMK